MGESNVCAGGQIVIATWCQREESPAQPLTKKDKADLQFLYDEWTHPHFISKEKYSHLMQARPTVPKQPPQAYLNLACELCEHCLACFRFSKARLVHTSQNKQTLLRITPMD